LDKSAFFEARICSQLLRSTAGIRTYQCWQAFGKITMLNPIASSHPAQQMPDRRSCRAFAGLAKNIRRRRCMTHWASSVSRPDDLYCRTPRTRASSLQKQGLAMAGIHLSCARGRHDLVSAWDLGTSLARTKMDE